jgi:hypothetical protein
LQVDNCEYGSWADLIASQRAMSTAIQATGRPMIIQIGAGDHMPLLNNPNASLSDSYARTFDDEAWVWCARPRQSFLSLSLSLSLSLLLPGRFQVQFLSHSCAKSDTEKRSIFVPSALAGRGPEVAHTWYTGNDKHNSWASTVHNVLQNYRGAEYFQKPGAAATLRASFLTCGTG